MSTRVRAAALLGAALLGGCVITETKTTTRATAVTWTTTTATTWTTTWTTTTPTTPTAPTDAFDPVAVGFELDAAMEADGTLVDYYLEDAAYPPAVVISFAGEGWFDGTDPGAICYVWAEYRPDLAPALATEDGAALRVGWEGELVLQGQDCGGRVDPGAWGADAERLYGPYDGARLGVGLGAMTPFLLEGWSEDDLAALGPSLLGEYVAIGDDPVARDWTSAGLFAWDVVTGDVIDDGSGYLVPVEVPAEGPLPASYVRSWAWWYEDL